MNPSAGAAHDAVFASVGAAGQGSPGNGGRCDPPKPGVGGFDPDPFEPSQVALNFPRMSQSNVPAGPRRVTIRLWSAMNSEWWSPTVLG